jgi:ubiquinone/menaquinone biosynthesis C-methylase UbiE
MNNSYVHGYETRENIRLQDQSETLEELLHSDTHYPAGSRVLEAGCGVGAQTVILARNSPGIHLTSIDISGVYLVQAAKRAAAEGLTNVEFRQADVYNLPFEAGSFDHIFVCFVLEHLLKPLEALGIFKNLLKPGGTLTAIEGDHGSTHFYPQSVEACKAIDCLVELQRRSGGNALIGRELYPMLCEAGYSQVRVSPRMVYVDSGKPELVEGFTKKTFTAMVEGIRKPALETGLISPEIFEKGIKDLYRTAERDGVFCYTFFKAFGTNK